MSKRWEDRSQVRKKNETREEHVRRDLQKYTVPERLSVTSTSRGSVYLILPHHRPPLEREHRSDDEASALLISFLLQSIGMYAVLWRLE